MDATIDYKCPSALLVTSFASYQEPDDEDPEIKPIITFETKPKSAAKEYVPSKVLKYIDENKESLQTFLSRE